MNEPGSGNVRYWFSEPDWVSLRNCLCIFYAVYAEQLAVEIGACWLWLKLRLFIIMVRLPFPGLSGEVALGGLIAVQLFLRCCL